MMALEQIAKREAEGVTLFKQARTSDARRFVLEHVARGHAAILEREIVHRIATKMEVELHPETTAEL